MIQVPDQALKNLLTVIDDVSYLLQRQGEADEGLDAQEARKLFDRLKRAKDELEEQAKEVKPEGNPP